MKTKYYFDVVIIGAGLAGLYTALELDSKYKVAILTKETLDENNSYLAQGGIAACVKKDDEFELHIKDTLKAGSDVNDIKKLEQLVKCAPFNIKELVSLGVEFDRDENGTVKTTMEAGHSRRRILHAGGDATGREIVKALDQEIWKRENISFLEDVMAIDLIKKNEECIGVSAIKGNTKINILAKAIVIATGGIGELYNYSTNSSVATGDGIAIANRVGCKIENMEFIQFHPTAFYSEDKGKKFLISEAVRGEGAYLRNKDGERFMEKYHPGLELAPRDIVSQSIYKELQETNSKNVYIDITHRDKGFLINRFPTIYNQCLKNNIDISKDYIPVVPVQHYSIGGIKVDINGRASIKNVYACGECSNTGVHGANRLASNSLLECLVFGRKIAEDISNNIENIKGYTFDEVDYVEKREEKISDKQVDVSRFRSIIKDTMETYAGIVRWESGLYKAKSIIEDVLAEMQSSYKYDKEFLEVFNMAIVAKLIVNACIKRKESLGCHLRIDEYMQ